MFRTQKNRSKTAQRWAWVETGHCDPGFRGSLHSKDIASVREKLRRFSHKDYLCFQR
jgi:hypothetical protein